MTEYRNAWDDPNVKAALKQRDAEHIYLICCERCGNYGYYNEGSSFGCSVEGCKWSTRNIDVLIDAGEVITLTNYTDMMVNAENLP